MSTLFLKIILCFLCITSSLQGGYERVAAELNSIKNDLEQTHKNITNHREQIQAISLASLWPTHVSPELSEILPPPIESIIGEYATPYYQTPKKTFDLTKHMDDEQEKLLQQENRIENAVHNYERLKKEFIKEENTQIIRIITQATCVSIIIAFLFAFTQQ